MRSNDSLRNSMSKWAVYFLVCMMCLARCVLADRLGNDPYKHQQFSWRDLTDTEMSEWYSPADLCVLNTAEKWSFPQDLRAEACKAYSKGSRRMFCGVGMGNNNYPCYGPFGDGRPSFRRGVEGFTNASSKPLLEFSKRLLDANAALMLLGDSTMRQKLQSFQCELSREDPKIRFHGNLFGIVPCDTRLRVFFPDGRELLVLGVSMGPKATECISKHYINRTLSAKEVDDIIKSDDAQGIYLHANHILEHLNEKAHKRAFIVANTGLWYNDEDNFAKVIPGVLRWLHRIQQAPHRNVAVWHETLRQHWISTDNTGYFNVQVVDAQEAEWPKMNFSLISAREYLVPHCCQAIRNASDWRNDIVRVQLQQNNEWQQAIPVLPMAKISESIPDLHTCNPGFKHDCTHYCFTPLLYQPLWHQMLHWSHRLFA